MTDMTDSQQVHVHTQLDILYLHCTMLARFQMMMCVLSYMMSEWLIMWQACRSLNIILKDGTFEHVNTLSMWNILLTKISYTIYLWCLPNNASPWSSVTFTIYLIRERERFILLLRRERERRVSEKEGVGEKRTSQMKKRPITWLKEKWESTELVNISCFDNRNTLNTHLLIE